MRMGIKRIGINITVYFIVILTPEYTGAHLIIGGGGGNVGNTAALILQGDVFVQTQRTAGGCTGGDRLTVGKGGGVSYLLAGLIGLGLGEIVIGFCILQHRLPIGQTDDAAVGINLAYARRTGYGTGRQSQEGGNKNEAFHQFALRNNHDLIVAVVPERNPLNSRNNLGLILL